MARTDIYGNPISCIKCKTGHRDISCNDSHPGPCFYRGKRGRPRKGEVGRARDPIPVPDCLLRPSSGVPGGPSSLPTPPTPSEAVGYPHLGGNDYAAFAAPAEASPWVSFSSSLDVPGQLPMAPLPTPPFEAVRHPHLGGNGHAASAAPSYLPSSAPSSSVPDFSGQFSVAPLCQPQIGGNGYDPTPAPPSLPGPPSLRDFWALDEPTGLVSDFFSEETLAGTEDQGPQDTEIAPVVPPAPRLPDLSAEPAAASRPDTWATTTEFMSMEDYSVWLNFDD